MKAVVWAAEKQGLTPEQKAAAAGVKTIDYNIFIEFTKNADGTVQGKLIGTDLKPVCPGWTLAPSRTASSASAVV